MLIDFGAEMTNIGDNDLRSWTIYVDRSSNQKGHRAGVMTENDKVTVEYSLKFDFLASNNQAEYEAYFAGIRAAKELGAITIMNFYDSLFIFF